MTGRHAIKVSEKILGEGTLEAKEVEIFIKDNSKYNDFRIRHHISFGKLHFKIIVKGKLFNRKFKITKREIDM